MKNEKCKVQNAKWDNWCLSPVICIVSLLLVISLCTAVYAVKVRVPFTGGEVLISGNPVEIEESLYTAKGNAKLNMVYTAKTVQPGSMRVEALEAGQMELRISRDAKGKERPSKALATGGVKIWGKRLDKKADAVLQDVYATARQATMDQTAGTLVLTGSVYIKITEPGRSEPVSDAECDKLTFDMKTNKLIFQGSEEPAKVSLTDKQ